MQKFNSLNKEEFFKEFSISDEYFKETGLDWDTLQEIYLDYSSLISYLEKEAEHIFSKLRDVPNVHSVRRRVKKPRHLIEKIIRPTRAAQASPICACSRQKPDCLPTLCRPYHPSANLFPQPLTLILAQN